MHCCNHYQKLGIATIVLAGLCLFPQVLIKFLAPQDSGIAKTREDICIFLLMAAVVCAGVALLYAENEGYRNPHREGYEQKSSGGGSKKSLGKKLKEQGVKVFTMKGCGFCDLQKDLFKKNPELELDVLVVDQADMSPEDKKGVQGFPTLKDQNGKHHPGFKKDISFFENLLK